MFDWLKKERCKVCREERSVRYCLRKNKEIGWQCCNNYRTDGKCPSECGYTPIKNESPSPLPQIKSDSRTEFMDFLQRYLQVWVYNKIEALDNTSPLELSQSTEGKTRLTNWLSTFSFPDSGVLKLLNNKLNLDLTIPADANSNPEMLAVSYLDAVIAQDWDKTVSFHTIAPETTKEMHNKLIDELATHPVLNKTKSHAIINAGFTEDGNQAFVFCELNGKENWTLIFVSVKGKWQLYQNIWGTLQDYYTQKNLFRILAYTLNQKDEPKAWHLLEDASKKYPLCPDVYYYYGLYYPLLNKTPEAKTSLQKALALEPNWQEPLFQLAMLDMTEKNFEAALLKWDRIIQINPSDINALNNIGVCYLGLNQPEQARTVWQNALRQDPNSALLKKNLEHLDNG